MAAHTTIDLQEQPDPVLGTQVPLLRSAIVKTPSGLTSCISAQRTVVPVDLENPLRLATFTDVLEMNGGTRTATFDRAQKQIMYTSAAARKVILKVDSHGRIVEIKVDGVLAFTVRYDEQGRLDRIAQGIDAAARTLTIRYDAEGRVGSMTDPLNREMHLQYNQLGQVTNRVLHDGSEQRFSYDSNGNLSCVYPSGQPAHAFQYTATNLVKEYVPPVVGDGGIPIQVIYNRDKQLTQITRADSSTIKFVYDHAGRLSKVLFPAEEYCYEYEQRTGNVSCIKTREGTIVSYGYDGTLLVTESWKGTIDSHVTRQYEDDCRLRSIQVGLGQLCNFEYDLDGLLTRAGDLFVERDPENGLIVATRVGHVTTKYERNGFGEIERVSAAINRTNVIDVRYDRDRVGRITQLTENCDGQMHVYSYHYDAMGRLRDVAKNGTNFAHYEYDDNGNRTFYEGHFGTARGHYDVQDRMLQYGESVYTYTSDGELASKTVNGEIFTYR